MLWCAPLKTLLHLVNPLVVHDPASDLAAAQPVTFAAMADARAFAAATRRAEVSLCAVGFPEDRAAFPDGFHVLDAGRFDTPRKLPLLGDLLARAVEAADKLGADWIVYTNVDIAPVPDFYTAIAALIGQGYDAFSVNRRTLPRDWPNGVSGLPLMRAQLGEAHPGRDCFVFTREAAREFDCGQTCIGAQFVGKVLAANLLCHARRYEDFADLHLTFHLGDDRRWLSPAQREYGDHNRRELAGVLGHLRASGRTSEHPSWTEMTRRFAHDADAD